MLEIVILLMNYLISMLSKQNRRFKPKYVQHDYRNKWIENISKASIMRMWMYIWLKDVWNPATCSCENGQYLTSIMVDSEIMCDEIIESCEEDVNVETKSNQSVKRKNSIFYLHFY